jgi:hypothetical protein
MAEAEPRLFADDRGVWREDTPGQPSGIPWDEVYRVTGYRLDGFPEVYTCVVLDWEYGEFVELYDHWPGFGQVAAAITERLPGIAPDWLARLEAQGTHDPSVELWRRAEPLYGL